MDILNRGIISLLLLFTASSGISSSHLECEYSMEYYNFIGTIYMCRGTVLLYSERVTAVIGVHESGKNSDDVQGLFIQQGNLTFVPTNIEAFFPNLIALNYHYTSITNVTNNHLRPFPALEYLSFLQNRITTLDNDLLTGLYSLKYINFRSNQLTFIGQDVILNLGSNMTCVDYGYNPCAFMNMQACQTGQLDNFKINLIVRCNINVVMHDLENRNRQLESQVVDSANTIESMSTAMIELEIENSRLERRVDVLENFKQNFTSCMLH